MQKLAIVDPGLNEAGGHHAALLNALLSTERKNTFDITVYSSLHIARELSELACHQNLNVKPWFTSNFYQHFDDNASLRGEAINTFIRGLASEYKTVITDLLNHLDINDKIVFWYPCVNWEHASALSLALSRLIKTKSYNDHSCKHKVCSMFMSQQPENQLTNLPFETAFKRLNQFKNVEVYASDLELKDYLEKLNIEVCGIHPCYLLPWPKFDKAKKDSNCQSGDSKTYLLYMGDAKENKGYMLLPALIERLSTVQSDNVRLIVQYTMTWPTPKLAEIEEKLIQLDKQIENLEVHREFWSVDELVFNLKVIDLIFCTYDPPAYQHKSSGLAWIACYFQIPVVLRGECWLTREFTRLYHPFEVSSTLSYSTQLLDKNFSQTTEYRSLLFQEPLDWIYQD